MSVVGEIALAAGLVAGVAAIISAYRDGSSIIEKAKRKRAERRQRPVPRQLEDSVNQAPSDIEREKDQGIARFGDAFKDGDTIVILSVQQIAIQVQASLLAKLRTAYEESTDFTTLINDAYMGRDNTIRALIEFQQRLLQSAPIVRMQSPPLGLLGESPVSMARMFSSEPLLGQDHAIMGQRHNQYARQREVGEPERQHRFGFFRRKSYHAHDSPYDQPSDHNADRVQRVYSLPQLANTTSHTSTSMSRTDTQISNVNSSTSSGQCDANSPNFVYEEWEDNLAEIWGSRSERSSCADSVVEFQPPAPTRSLTAGSGSGTIRHPGPSNDYLGFCKGAWKLQCGDDHAMVESRDYTQSAQSRPAFVRCSDCRFEGHIDPRKIWHKLWTFDKLGIRIRWAFLAKSHVKQKTSMDRKSASKGLFTYNCMFCIFSGIQSPAMNGTQSYLQHIRQYHHYGTLSDVVLDRTSCISGRRCDDNEDFDINLFPVLDDKITELE